MSDERAAVSERRRQVWIPTVEAAALLGADMSALYRLIAEGHIKATRIGLMPYVNLRDLHPFLRVASSP